MGDIRHISESARFISENLKDIALTPTQAYISDRVQVADILEWILSQTKEADVIQTSFSISEEFLRRLFFMKKKGYIKSLSLLLDLKATNKTVKLWQFISQVYDHSYLGENHSKVLLIIPESGINPVAVVTSQNLTRGNRYESAVISTEKAVVNPLLEEINHIIKNYSIPLNELFGQTD